MSKCKYKRRNRLPTEAFEALETGDTKRWNKWRSDHPTVPVDFRSMYAPDPVPGASLYRTNLSKADLRGASLERADLSGTVLDGAKLRGASLRRAILFETSLLGADLTNEIVIDAFVRRVKWDQKTKERGLLGLTRVWFTTDRLADFSGSKVDDLRAAALLSMIGERGAVSSLVNAGSKTVVLILGRFGNVNKEKLSYYFRKYKKISF